MRFAIRYSIDYGSFLYSKLLLRGKVSTPEPTCDIIIQYTLKHLADPESVRIQRQVPVRPVIKDHLDHVSGFCVDQRAQSPVNLEVAWFFCFERWICVLLKYDWSWCASTNILKKTTKS